MVSLPRKKSLSSSKIHTIVLRSENSEKQYKRKFSQWKVEKNMKSHEAEAMIRIQSERAQGLGKDTAFRLRKRPVPPEKITRYAKRRKLSQANDTPDFEFSGRSSKASLT